MSDDIVRAGPRLPRLASAGHLGSRLVELGWRDGSTTIIDLAPVLMSRRIFKALRQDDALFSTLSVSEFGDAIEWDDGTDLSAVWLKALPDAGLSNTEFRLAMEKLGMSLDGMAAALGLSRRLIAAYRKDRPVPRHVALATRYLVERANPLGAVS